MLTSVTANALTRGLLEKGKVIPYNKAVEEKEKFRELVERLSWENLTEDELGFVNELTPFQKENTLLKTSIVDIEYLLVANSMRGWTNHKVNYEILRDDFNIVPKFKSSDIPYVRGYLKNCTTVKLSNPVPLFSPNETLIHEDLIDLKKRMTSENFKIFMDELRTYLSLLNNLTYFLLDLYNLISDKDITMNVLSKKFPELYKIYKESHENS